MKGLLLFVFCTLVLVAMYNPWRGQEHINRIVDSVFVVVNIFLVVTGLLFGVLLFFSGIRTKGFFLSVFCILYLAVMCKPGRSQLRQNKSYLDGSVH